MHWDSRTGAPKNGSEDRAESIGQLSTDIFNIQTSDRMKELIDVLYERFDDLSEDTKKAVELAKKEYEENKKSLKQNIGNMLFFVLRLRRRGRKRKENLISVCLPLIWRN